MSARRDVTQRRDAGPARRARLANQVVFLTVGLLVGSWFSRMPRFKDALSLTYAELGWVLLAQAVGLLLAMQVAGLVTARYGSKPVTRLFALLAAWSYVLLSTAPNLHSAIAVMFVSGFVAGILDVAMNAQGLEIERVVGRPVLHSMHAAWGIGALAGGALGAAATRGAWPLDQHFGAVAIGVSLLLIASGPWLLAPNAVPSSPDASEHRRPTWRMGWSWAVVALGGVGAAAALTEAVSSSWSTIFLHEARGAAADVAAAGFTVFMVAQTGTRLVGDRLQHAYGPVILLRCSAAVAAGGLLLILAVTNVWSAMAGFALMGSGVALANPIVFSTIGSGAAGLTGAPTGVLLARVAMMIYGGALLGPALIGWLADAVGLSAALSGLVLPLAVVVLGARHTARRRVGGVKAP
ncbi:MFS transporter [Mangrovihabitans endophyticus]|uniref:MFS transporter n=1 Tax=Mangrovihabitans endophyticus TaxID=1751298 RepID=A0A8J3C947_9ACTN|nr:MFS transporter [Mangrovihabitans endophyticus]GGL20703.1 MFS transporter [Mangrovihabitans endophyticus]